MRPIRLTCAAALAAASLAVPAVAAAAPTVSVAPTGQLGPEGVSATIVVTAACDAGAQSAVLSVTVEQAASKRLVTGSGSIGFMGLGTIVCDGAPHDVAVVVNAATYVPNPAPFRSGKAAVTASLSDSGPSGYESASTGWVEVSLKK
jgi:hypothetical protein